MYRPHESAPTPHAGTGLSVLVVDDHPLNRELIARWLNRDGHTAVEAEDGAHALELLEHLEIDLILLDTHMPVMDGAQVLRALRADARFRDIPVVAIAPAGDTGVVARCLEQGADDYLFRPIEAGLLTARAQAVQARRRLHELESEFEQAVQERARTIERDVVRALRSGVRAAHAALFEVARLAGAKDWKHDPHLDRMREYCRALTVQLARREPYDRVITLQFIETVPRAAMLYDIGKAAVPDSILLKPGALQAAEREVMQTHATLGAAALRRAAADHPDEPLLRLAIDIAGAHHERWDGTGYPLGLRGEAIPLAGRIVALCDAYDAIVSRRPYKEAGDADTARAQIEAGRGTQFDPDVVDAFLSVESEFREIRGNSAAATND